MFDKNEIKKITEERKRWESTTVPKWIETRPEREKSSIRFLEFQLSVFTRQKISKIWII